MELDTGLAVSIQNPFQKYKEMFHHIPLMTAKAILKTYMYSRERIIPKGKLDAHVKYNNQVKDLMLYVVKTLGPALFGERLVAPDSTTLETHWFYHKGSKLGKIHRMCSRMKLAHSSQPEPSSPYKKAASQSFVKQDLFHTP